MPGDGKATPTLLSSGTARSIRDALIDVERAEFERRFAEEMASAAQTLDLTGVLQVLGTYRKIAEITQRQGAAAHRRMLDQVTRLQSGDDVPASSSLRPGKVLHTEMTKRTAVCGPCPSGREPREWLSTSSWRNSAGWSLSA